MSEPMKFKSPDKKFTVEVTPCQRLDGGTSYDIAAIYKNTRVGSIFVDSAEYIDTLCSGLKVAAQANTPPMKVIIAYLKQYEPYDPDVTPASDMLLRSTDFIINEVSEIMEVDQRTVVTALLATGFELYTYPRLGWAMQYKRVVNSE